MLSQMRKFITVVFFAAGMAIGGSASAQATKAPPALKADVPDRYVVVQGDTLWSIAQRYTDAPWRWPELWNLNKDQIKNPHLIYPGNVIRLDRLRGILALSGIVRKTPKIRIEGSTEKAIPSIPPSAIEPFLVRPLVVEPDGLDNAPTIVASEDDRVILSAGNFAYVRGMSNTDEKVWYVYRRGKALVDPDTEKVLGYEALFLGTAQLVRAGEPATIRLLSAVQEIVKGDKLVAAGKPQIPTYAPHAPSAATKGRVISIYGNIGGKLGESGPQSVITINRGKADGIEAGHVLALYRHGATVSDASRGGTDITLPDERYGLIFVFRVFDRVSYSLVMKISRPVNTLDVVRNP